MSPAPKVIGTYRTRDGLNLRIVADASHQEPIRYTLERRTDDDKDAMGTERWHTEDLDDSPGRGYDLLRWLGQKLEADK